MYNTDYLPKWEKHSRTAFWGVTTAQLVGFISTVFFIIYIGPMIVVSIMSSLFSNNIYDKVLSELGGAYVLMKLIVLVGSIVYAKSLGGFADVQADEETKSAILRVRTGVIIQIVTSVLMYLSPIFLNISIEAFFVYYFFLWIADIVACVLIAKGFGILREHTSYSLKARQGARNLRYAAVCGVRLLVLPVVTVLLALIIVLSSIGGAGYTAQNVHVTGMNYASFDSVTSGINGISTIIQTGGYLLLFTLIVATVLAVCWSIPALIYPIIGWSRLRCGYLESPDDNDTEEIATIPVVAQTEPTTTTEEKADVSIDEETPTEPTEPKKTGEADKAPVTTRKYWPYILGICLVVIALAIVFFTKSQDNAGTEDEQLEQPELVDAVEEEEEEIIKTVTAYSVLNRGDYELYLMADINGELVDTKLHYSDIVSLDIVKTADFNGDGNQDCLVCWFTGGNSSECYGTNLVYYSQEDGAFHQIENISAVEVEEWKGKPSLIKQAGISFTRYVLEEGQLKEAESKTADVGETVWKRTREELFPVKDEDSEDVETWFDMDDDGEDEMLVFGHESSHANNWGEDMYLCRIKWNDGERTVEADALPWPGEDFVILSHTTNDMHDILVSNWLFRWNGSNYERWLYNGKELTPVSSDQ